MHTHMGGIRGGALTDIGLRRAVNEDAVLSARSIFAVADGMGGHEAGDLASRLCIETLAEIAVDPAAVGPSGLPHAQAVLAQVERADAMIRGAIGSRGGTTLCALALVSCEPGGGTWPQEKPAAATTLELPVQPDAAAAPDGDVSPPRYLETVQEAHVHPGDAVFHHGPAGAAEPVPTTDVLPYVPVPGAGTPAVTRLDARSSRTPPPRSDAPLGHTSRDPGPGHEPAVRLMLLNVGDSRGYRLREGKLTQLTLDHSAVQELIDAGTITEAEARIHPQRNLITRALGAGGNSVPDSQFHELVAGDRYLLCSDGLTGEVDPAGIERILNQTPDRAEALARLVDAALASGGRDNISVVIVDVSEPGQPGLTRAGRHPRRRHHARHGGARLIPRSAIVGQNGRVSHQEATQPATTTQQPEPFPGPDPTGDFASGDGLPSEALRAEYQDLVDQVRKHRAAYYNDDAPLISDAEFDQLYSRLELIEAQHPAIVANDSPTQEVGGEVSAAFTPVEHLSRMYSLEDVFSLEEVVAWGEKTAANAALRAAGHELKWLCEVKIDGLAVNLLYRNGKLVRAATRGDGYHRRGRHAQRADHQGHPHPAGGGELARRGGGARGDLHPLGANSPPTTRRSSRRARRRWPTRATPRPDPSARRTRRRPPSAR